MPTSWLFPKTQSLAIAPTPTLVANTFFSCCWLADTQDGGNCAFRLQTFSKSCMPTHPLKSSREHFSTNTPITSALHTIILLASFATKNHLGPSAFVPVAVSFHTNTVLICFCWRIRPTTIFLIAPGVVCLHPDCCHISLLGTKIFSTFSVTKDVNVSLRPSQPSSQLRALPVFPQFERTQHQTRQMTIGQPFLNFALSLTTRRSNHPRTCDWLAWCGETKAENEKVHEIECGGPHTFHDLCPTQTFSKTFSFHSSI